jgi:hypothetical protein
MLKRVLILITFSILLLSSPAFTENMAKTVYQDPYFLKFNSHFYRDDAIDENGCSIHNQRSHVFHLIDQVLCWNAIAHGIGTGQEKHIRKGMDAIWYGFEKEYRNGEFKSSSIAHAFRFLFAVSISYLDIKYNTNENLKEKYMSEFRENADKIANIAYWIKDSEQLKRDMHGIEESANQLTGLGIIYYNIGDMLGDERLISFGKSFIDEGIAMQTDEGVFLEKGGFDSSYQSVNLQFMSYLYLYEIVDVPTKDEILTRMKKG